VAASRGCKILATDLNAKEDTAKSWLNTKQSSSNNVMKLYREGVCSKNINEKM
jgi:hypothetical protein